ncbi:exodeoxyribonuclease III [Legionella septentrionalis]|uniref:exodeoxyribonuclease III n=1 Tax=Legionella septentrionalis TaxID=2498109 RepID=UPI000F8DF759|nr:exodeoxyribonuclease III [Legionella septentrionalis]RUQ99316.1 exodeoxyribonuclease III [Legionella septentrionalis]
MLKIASWNVNSLKIRLEQVLSWLKSSEVDILALQETKLIDEQFPTFEFHNQGYHVAYTGQKTYNGVAVISRKPIEQVTIEVPGFMDPQRRMLAVTIAGMRLINLYVPNGSEVGSSKYQYKLNWLEVMTGFIQQELKHYPHLAVVGDFNIAPEDKDVHDPSVWDGCVMVSPQERKAFADLALLGLHDSFRCLHPEEQAYTWWDYRTACFRRNRGLRIDHILLSDKLRQHCLESWIDVEPRRAERPSDHAPVCAKLSELQLHLL